MRVRDVVVCLVAVVLAAQAGPLADSSKDLHRAKSLVQRGDKAFQSGDLAKARQQFDDAIKAFPTCSEARMGLGHVAMKEGRFEDAVTEYTLARDSYAENHDLLFSFEVERYNDAQREIRRLEDEKLNINNPAVKVSDATRNAKNMQLDQAIQKLRAMPYPDEGQVAQPPAELYFHLGNALFRLERHGEALAAWEACVETDPGFGLVYNNLAVAYMMQGRFSEARDSIDRAEKLGIQVNPNLKADIERRAAGG